MNEAVPGKRGAYRQTLKRLGERNRVIERENRVLKELQQDVDERHQAPADIEGVGNKVAVIILRDKNMGEVKRVIDDFANMASARPEGHPELPPIGYRNAVNYVRTDGAKMIFAVEVIGPYSVNLVRARHAVEMFIHNRAGLLVLPRYLPPPWGVIGEQQRAALHGLVVRELFRPSVPYVFGLSQETEVQPVEAERKGFG